MWLSGSARKLCPGLAGYDHFVEVRHCDTENCSYTEFVLFMVWSHELIVIVRFLCPLSAPAPPPPFFFLLETVLLQPWVVSDAQQSYAPYQLLEL